MAINYNDRRYLFISNVRRINWLFKPYTHPMLRASPPPMLATMILSPGEGAARKFAYELKFKQFIKFLLISLQYSV
jgi:hypothetical protein